MTLGIIAREFPPARGGMPAVAAHLAEELSHRIRVRVYTTRRGALPGAGFEVCNGLAGELERDGARLRGERVEAWLATNAGYTPLAARLEAPFFAYLHGNDFLSPFLAMRRIDGPRRTLSRFVPSRWALRAAAAAKRRVIGAAIPHARHLFTNSHNTLRLLRKTHPASRGRTTVVNPGVSERFFAPCERPSSDRLRLLTVARLANPRKNVESVLEALARIRSQLEFDYEVVGEGPLRVRYEACARRLGLGDRVRFLGALDDDGLLQAYRRADLFALVPRSGPRDVEGFGIVYLEAPACGTPVLGAPGNGSADAVREGRNGLLARSASPADVAEAILRFARERGRFAPERVRAAAEPFRWPRVAERLWSALEGRL